MQKVKGIGGIFFASRKSTELIKWYKETLGVPVTPDGCGIFRWREHEAPQAAHETVWLAMPSDTEYLGKSESRFMINYIVESLDSFLEQLKSAGIKMEDKVEECEQGRFAWGYDPDGNRFELWEPWKEQK